MNPSYFSFLLCFHPAQTDIYYTGICIGQIINGQFIPARLNLTDGATKEIAIENLPRPCPFKSFDELKDSVVAAVGRIQIGEKVEEKS